MREGRKRSGLTTRVQDSEKSSRQIHTASKPGDRLIGHRLQEDALRPWPLWVPVLSSAASWAARVTCGTIRWAFAGTWNWDTPAAKPRGPVKPTHRWLGPDQTLTFIFYINAWQNLSSSGHEGSGLQPQQSRTFLLQPLHQGLAWFFPPRIKIIWRVLATFGLCDLPSITPQRLGTLFLNHPAAGRQESALCTVPTCRSHLQALWP